ncbi:MAG: hypothetical protein C5B50_08145 [Verrucomicrobia bacterium]|nr:MAG: hypothetical protein C5B50_08145 [Verrucomicrobiota bacterium]
MFNPAAKGDKARRFRRHLDAFAAECAVKLTGAIGDARRLAAEAVKEGFETIVAAGGDGTVNEVLNGLGDVPEGFEKARLAVLPLGTVNVFARELGLRLKLRAAWQIIQAGREMRIDLPAIKCVDCKTAVSSAPTNTGHSSQGRRDASPTLERRYFAQMAGAGLDSRAVELVEWQMKKRIGPLAYVLAGLKAMRIAPCQITASGGGHSVCGQLVLVGNGLRYGGEFRLFPKADLHDGLMDVCVFPRVNWLTLLRCAPSLLVRGTAPESLTECFQTPTLTVTAIGAMPLQADGELIGHLPATFSVEKSKLRIVVP